MSVKLNIREVGDVTVIDVSGRISLGEGSGAIRNAIRDLATGGSRKIVLNLGDVWYIDSSGIGELVSSFTSMSSAGGELKLANLTKRVKEMLEITRLFTFFDVREDEADAVQSFK